MDIALYTNYVVPHQLPLAKELVGIVGSEHYTYVYTSELSKERVRLGYPSVFSESWIRKGSVDNPEDRRLLEGRDVLMCDGRAVDLLEARGLKRKLSYYVSERWFKPLVVTMFGRIEVKLPGIIRLMSPRYFRMAWRFFKLFKNDQLYYLPQGVHAASDMARLCGLMNGDLRCIIRAPAIQFERRPGGRVSLCGSGDGRRFCIDRMFMWGYFVGSGDARRPRGIFEKRPCVRRVLWVGRLLKLKHVDVIVKAVQKCHGRCKNDQSLPRITLDIYGVGPEEKSLKNLAKGDENIRFHGSVPYEKVRELMREHDIYVFASDAADGWGAVVSEALEEGMAVLGSYEAGASATLLPDGNLFHALDCERLSYLLQHEICYTGIGDWTAKIAARNFVELVGENNGK